eukprot:scaffold77691_cov30-Tisochrysis_lutea.AAC.6
MRTGSQRTVGRWRWPPRRVHCLAMATPSWCLGIVVPTSAGGKRTTCTARGSRLTHGCYDGGELAQRVHAPGTLNRLARGLS